MHFYVLVLWLAVLHICVNCDNEYDNLNLLELLKNIDQKNIDNLSDNMAIIVLQPKEDSEVNSKVYEEDNEINNENKDFEYETKPALRGGVDLSRIEKSNTGKILKHQHKKKMEELIDFLKDHYSSTNYFYNEMQRIQRQHEVKDKMREMVEFLEDPDHWRMKRRILAIFEKLKRKRKEQDTLWDPKTNNLVINVLKDPYNDGVD